MVDMKCICPFPERHGEHMVTCPSYEPPLTQEEIRGVRAMLRLTGYDSRFADSAASAQVGSGDSAPETGQEG